MDEMKTNPPVQNSPAEPPKKVRRVGTMAFAVLLIAGGVLLLAQQFMPKANLLAVLKFAPVILIVLGIEVLVYSTKPNVKLKFDWLGILGCAFVLVVVGTASLTRRPRQCRAARWPGTGWAARTATPKNASSSRSWTACTSSFPPIRS